MKKTVRAYAVTGLIGISFALGYAFAQSGAEKAITQAHADLDANAVQMTKDLNAINAELKRIVQATNIDLGQSEQLHKELEGKMATLIVELETSMVRSHIAVLEKTVHNNNIEADAHARLAEFFQADPAYINGLKGKGVTIGSMVTGFGIAKATNQKSADVFKQYEDKQSWAAIAQTGKLKPGELLKALNGLIPNQ